MNTQEIEIREIKIWEINIRDIKIWEIEFGILIAYQLGHSGICGIYFSHYPQIEFFGIRSLWKHTAELRT